MEPTDTHDGEAPRLPDRYRLIERLGGGNFGEVFRCWDDSLRTEVAIKILDKKHAQDAQIRDLFLREARVLRSAGSEFLVPVHAYGVLDEDQPYLVMSVASRGTLAKRIGPARNVDDAGFQRVLRQLTEAVAATRAMDLIHRDIKPSNVLIRANRSSRAEGSELLAGDESIWLADFGLVASDHELTRAGTPRYAAPEQLTPGEAVDHRADIYATAVTLTELLTGRPFTAEQLAQDKESHLPSSVRAVLARGAHPDPAQRWGSVEEMAAGLVMAPEASTADRPDDEGHRAGWGTWRTPLLAGAAAFAAIAIGVAVLGSVRGDGSDTDEAADAVPTTAPAETAPANTASSTVDQVSTETKVGGDFSEAPPWPEPVEVSIPDDGRYLPMSQLLLTDPSRAILDQDGNVYVTDTNAHAIWRLGPDGRAARVAGGNGAGYAGDGGPALDAQLFQPVGIIADDEGGLLFVERSNRTLRRINADGVISTVLGGPEETTLGDPINLARDQAGRLLIADFGLHHIMAYSEDGELEVIAGTGLAGYSGDGGPATDAQLMGPIDIAVTPTGDLLIADYFNHRVRRISLDGTIETVLGTGSDLVSVGEGPGTSTPFPNPSDIAFVGSQILVLSEGASLIAKLDESDSIEILAQSSTDGVFNDDRLTRPSDLLWTGEELLVVDAGSNRVHRVDSSGSLATIAGTGSVGSRGDGRLGAQVALDQPLRLAINRFDQIAVIQQVGIVRWISPQGRALTYISGGQGRSEEGTTPERLRLGVPSDIAFTSNDEMIIAEAGNNRVIGVGLSEQGVLRMRLVAGTGGAGTSDGDGDARLSQIDRPLAVDVGPQDELYIADRTRVVQVSADGAIETLYAHGGNEAVSSFAVSDRKLYIAELTRGVIRTFDLDEGSFIVDETYVLGAEYGVPVSLAIDDSSLYVATGLNRVARIDLETGAGPLPFAGTGEAGFSGDGGPAVEAQLNLASGLEVDRDGRLIIADSGNHRIRVVADGVITTLAGGVGSGSSS